MGGSNIHQKLNFSIFDEALGIPLTSSLQDWFNCLFQHFSTFSQFLAFFTSFLSIILSVHFLVPPLNALKISRLYSKISSRKTHCHIENYNCLFFSFFLKRVNIRGAQVAKKNDSLYPARNIKNWKIRQKSKNSFKIEFWIMIDLS